MTSLQPGASVLVLLLGSVLGSLPAPVNVSIHSVNFHHILHWYAAPGTPLGTEYKIFRRVQGKKLKRVLDSTTTSFKLMLDNFKTYYLSVKAIYNYTLSPESHNIIFTPYKDTKIGLPYLSLAGCGSCIQVNMSLPEADSSSGISDIHQFYDVLFSIWWRKEGERKEKGKPVMSTVTQHKSFTLDNLQEGMEYCVQVHTKIRLNSNTEPSAWKCTFTRTVERRDPVVLGAVTALLIVVSGVLMATTFCLHYAGFLCNLKASLPRVIIVALSKGYALTPEETIPDPVSISSEKDKQRKRNKTTMPHPVAGDEDDYEEEEEGINIYMDRNTQLSSGESLFWDSADVRGNSKPATPGDCGSLTQRLSAEGETTDAQVEGRVPHGGVDKDETKAKVSPMSEEGQTAFQGHVTGEEKEEEMMKNRREVFESSGNVNLFSVILTALGAGEEEEQSMKDSQTDLMKSPRATYSHTDTQIVDHTTVAVAQTTNEEFTRTGYEGRRGNYITT